MPARLLAGLCPACLLAQGAATENPRPSHPFQPPAIEELAKLFPQLEILQLLGAGGMGAVYKARQPALDRIVALKILPAIGSSSGNFPERFNREARALARLSHPNIVAVHEFGQAGELHFFIMEYVDGANLRQLEQNERLTPRQALQIIPQICDALQYAHDEGVVHRDIKPENVLIDRKGRVKIADFGLAKILQRDPEALRLTVEGQVMGTPHYMAPEQVERPLTVDHRADIYSLGVVLYEMLTGDLPLGNFAPPSRKVRLDVRLDDVVLRALENDPERRYQHASEVKSQMQSIGHAPPQVTVPAPHKPVEKSSAEPRCVRWAGIPVVSEINGEREVNWNGTVSALVAALLSLAVGFLTVHLITGKGNIPGTLQVCAVVAVLIVLRGVRKTLNDPLPSVRQARPWYRDQRLSFAVIPAFVIAWSLFQLHWLTPKIKEWMGNAPYAQVAAIDPATGAMTATLPEKGTIEILGISERGMAPNQWWRPDGRAVRDTDFEVHNLSTTGREAAECRRVVVKVADLPAGADGPILEAAEDGTSNTSGGAVFSGGREQRKLRPVEFSWPELPRKSVLRIGVAIKPFQTIMTCKADGRQVTQNVIPGAPRWDVQVHNVGEGKDGVQITVVMPKADRNWIFDMAAIDQAGKERTYRMGSGSPVPGGNGSIWTYTFRGLLPKEAKEFRVSARPVHWVEFRDVAMHPASPLPEAKPLRFAPEVREIFTGPIDLDSASAVTAQTGIASTDPREAGGRDADLVVEKGALNNFGTMFALVKNEDWEALSPQQVIDSVYQGLFAPQALSPTGDGGALRTFSYRTRDGGFGLLQFVEPQNAGATVNLRIKRVLR
jgi:predicted Ser/Thr protein kinase